MPFESIQQLLESPLYKPQLDQVINLNSNFLESPNKEDFYKKYDQPIDEEKLSQYKIFDKFSPYKEIDSFDVFRHKLRSNKAIASIVPTGGEIPGTSFGDLVSIQGDMAKLSLSHPYDEEIMKQIYKFRNNGNFPQSFIDHLFGSVKDLKEKVFKLGNLLTAQLWSTGRVLFTDPRTGMQLNLKYNTYPELFPEALTGGATWDNYQTANGIEDIIQLNRAFYRLNGYYCRYIAMSEEACTHLLRQDSSSRYAQSLGLINSSLDYSGGLPSRVSRKILKQISEDVPEFPEIYQWDARYELEVSPGQNRSYNYIPTNRIALMNVGAVERLWGLTLESTMIGKYKGFGRTSTMTKAKGGIFTYAGEVEKTSPPLSRSLSVGCFLPWCDDTRKISGQLVF